MAAEAVDHPKHYGGDVPYEHVKVAEAWGLVDTPKIGAWLYNCTKYICRVGKKEGADPLEDLRKAKWYLDRAVERLAREDQDKKAGSSVAQSPFPGYLNEYQRGISGHGPHHDKCDTPGGSHPTCTWWSKEKA